MMGAALLLLGAVQSSIPVLSGNSILVPSDGACNLAVVRGLRSAGLSVRAGPGVRFKKIGSVRNGERVYTCNEHRGWWGVVYSWPGIACGGGDSLPEVRAPTCRSGWVHRDWIEIITG